MRPKATIVYHLQMWDQEEFQIAFRILFLIVSSIWKLKTVISMCMSQHMLEAAEWLVEHQPKSLSSLHHFGTQSCFLLWRFLGEKQWHWIETYSTSRATDFKCLWRQNCSTRYDSKWRKIRQRFNWLVLAAQCPLITSPSVRGTLWSYF